MVNPLVCMYSRVIVQDSLFALCVCLYVVSSVSMEFEDWNTFKRYNFKLLVDLSLF